MRFVLPVGLALFLAAGCGPSKMAKDQLEVARKAYAQAQAAPNVNPKARPWRGRGAWPVTSVFCSGSRENRTKPKASAVAMNAPDCGDASVGVSGGSGTKPFLTLTRTLPLSRSAWR